MKLHLLLPIAPHHSHYPVNSPPTPPHRPWKNCLPQNRSPVPKKVGDCRFKKCSSDPHSPAQTLTWDFRMMCKVVTMASDVPLPPTASGSLTCLDLISSHSAPVCSALAFGHSSDTPSPLPSQDLECSPSTTP